LWAPTDFDGAWVEIQDGSENGCWTNLGEVKEYATDQLALVGFKTVDREAMLKDDPSYFFRKNPVVLIISVSGKRSSYGRCSGSVLGYFVGTVILRKDETRLVMNTIGYPAAGAMMNPTNFNTQILDFVKGFLPRWIENGKVSN
jgi:hypothetical protein